MTENEFQKQKNNLKGNIASIKKVISRGKAGTKTATKLKRAEKNYMNFCKGYTTLKSKLKSSEENIMTFKEYTNFTISDYFGFNRRISISEEELNTRYRNKKKNAKSRDIEFNLSREVFDILFKQRECYYTGYKFKDVEEMSLERVDNDKGYTDDNCIMTHKEINNGKADLSLEELKSSYVRTIKNKEPLFKLNLTPKELECVYLKTEQFLNLKPLIEFNPCL